MFLRGAGSQSFTQFNGVKFGDSSTKYESGDVGEIQGDSARRMYGDLGFFAMGMVNKGTRYSPFTSYPGWSGWFYGDDETSSCSAWCFSTNPNTTYENPADIKFTYNPKHYRYRLDGSGGEYAYYSLSEYTSPAENDEVSPMSIAFADCGLDNNLVQPIDNEIRPVNIAVKYYIRAK